VAWLISGRFLNASHWPARVSRSSIKPGSSLDPLGFGTHQQTAPGACQHTESTLGRLRSFFAVNPPGNAHSLAVGLEDQEAAGT